MKSVLDNFENQQKSNGIVLSVGTCFSDKMKVPAGFAAQADCTGHAAASEALAEQDLLNPLLLSLPLETRIPFFWESGFGSVSSLPPHLSLFSLIRSAVWILRLSLLLTCCCSSWRAFLSCNILLYTSLSFCPPHNCTIRSTISTLFCVLGQEISHSEVKDEKRT